MVAAAPPTRTCATVQEGGEARGAGEALYAVDMQTSEGAQSHTMHMYHEASVAAKRDTEHVCEYAA